ncbi:MAG: hypothetical protein CMJ32_02095 [Phycisphaerae bacterium]|nr:hypothetical protein [Phycisphaerae bacterium]
MNKNKDGKYLALGIACSLLIHFAVILPMLILASASQGDSSTLVQYTPEQPEEEEKEDEEEEITLGIDESEAATLTWIGYEQYQEHMAMLAEQEQAAMTLENVPAAEVVGPSTQAPAQATRMDQGRPLTQAQSAAEAPDQPQEQEEPTNGGATKPALKLPPQAVEPTDPDVRKVLPGTSEPAPASTNDGKTEDTSEEAPEEATEPEPAKKQPVEKTDTPSPPADPGDAPSDQPEQPAPPQEPEAEPNEGAPKEAPPAEGDPSEREADPTSIVDVPPSLWRNGRPLAAHGLTLMTRRPRFTELTQITTTPTDPVCRIEFRSNGTVSSAKIIQSSGYTRLIDEPVLDSLYNWTARGDQLRTLGPNQVVRITIRIRLIG